MEFFNTHACYQQLWRKRTLGGKPSTRNDMVYTSHHPQMSRGFSLNRELSRSFGQLFFFRLQLLYCDADRLGGNTVRHHH
jgi:hypothetical protein